MGKSINKTFMNVFLILVFTKTSEQKGTGLSLARMTTLDYSRHSFSYLFHDLDVSTLHECAQCFDC